MNIHTLNSLTQYIITKKVNEYTTSLCTYTFAVWMLMGLTTSFKVCIPDEVYYLS